VPLRGLLADNVYQDLVGVTEPEERRRRIIAAAERHSSAQRPQQRRGRTFVGATPRIAGFTGRADEIDRLDAILTQDKPAAVTQIGRAAGRAWAGSEKPRLRWNMPTDSATSMTGSGKLIGWPIGHSAKRSVIAPCLGPFALRRKIGGEGGIGDYIAKPKGMHRDTFEGAMARNNAAEEIVDWHGDLLLERLTRRERK
jgi:hypothetical protein